jgi:hypothetical protein
VISAPRRKEGVPIEKRKSTNKNTQQINHHQRKRKRQARTFNRCLMNAYILLIS